MRLNEYAEAPRHGSDRKTLAAPDPIRTPTATPARSSSPASAPPASSASPRAHVAIVGCGAREQPPPRCSPAPASARLTLIDRDFVEPSNLQRQILFDEADARDSLPKAEAARRHIARFNSSVTVHAHIADLVPANIAELLAGADIILDATDNFETRYLINDFAVQQGKPWIYAAAIGAYAATMNILPAAPS